MNRIPGEFMGDSFYSANNAAEIDFALTTEGCLKTFSYILNELKWIVNTRTAGIDSAGLFGWLEITGSLRYWSTGEEIRPGEQLAAKFRDFSRLKAKQSEYYDKLNDPIRHSLKKWGVLLLPGRKRPKPKWQPKISLFTGEVHNCYWGKTTKKSCS